MLQDPKLDWLEPFQAFDGLQYAPRPSALERLDGDTPTEVMSLSIDQLVESVWKPYFLQGALTTEDRRAHEGELLEQYRGALALPAEKLPALDEVWTRCRASVAHGLALWSCTASVGGALWQRVEVAVALAQRYANAYGDLETPAAIAEIASSADD